MANPVSTPVFGHTPVRIGFLLLAQFSLMALSSFSEPLRAANRVSSRRLYDWSLLSEQGEPVEASNGMQSVVDHPLSAAPPIDLLVVMSSFEPERATTRGVLQYLQHVRRSGAVLCGVDTGSFVLARVGLLDGYGATVHWQVLDQFRERFPRVRVTQDLFVIDRKRWTAAGGTACIDLALNMIHAQHGQELASAVADEFVYSRIRAPHEAQRMPLGERLAASNPKLLQAVRLMEETLEEPVTSAEIARSLAISQRELERVFRRWLGRTPASFYRQLRLERARSLLQSSDRSVTDVAVACGFNSAANFSRCYKRVFGRSPRDSRVPLR